MYVSQVVHCVLGGRVYGLVSGGILVSRRIRMNRHGGCWQAGEGKNNVRVPRSSARSHDHQHTTERRYAIPQLPQHAHCTMSFPPGLQGTHRPGSEASGAALRPEGGGPKARAAQGGPERGESIGPPPPTPEGSTYHCFSQLYNLFLPASNKRKLKLIQGWRRLRGRRRRRGNGRWADLSGQDRLTSICRLPPWSSTCSARATRPRARPPSHAPVAGGGSGGRRLGTGCTPSPWIFSEDRLRTLRNGKKHHANWNLDWPCVIHQPNNLKLRLKEARPLTCTTYRIPPFPPRPTSSPRLGAAARPSRRGWRRRSVYRHPLWATSASVDYV